MGFLVFNLKIKDMGLTAMRVPTIFTAVDRFSGVVSRMTGSVSAFGQTAQASSLRASRQLNNVGTSMLTTGTSAAVGLGVMVNEAMKFEKAMANVNTTIDDSPEVLKSMSEEVLKMAKRIPKPISELTEALYDVVSAGIDSKDSMTVLNASGRLAVTGLGTTQEAVDVLTSSLNSFNLEGKSSEQIANMVFKAVKFGKTTVSQLAESFGSSSALIKNSNVSLGEYLATTAVLTTTGMTASRAQTQIASAVTALIKPSGAMSKVFNKLGVKDVPKWIKNNGGLVQSLRIVRDEADKMGVITSKAFGRKEGFSAMLSLLGPLNDQYKKVMKDMASGNDTLSASFRKQQFTSSSAFQLMKNNATILAITLGNELLPRMNGFMDIIIPMIQGMAKWIKRNEGLVTLILNVTVGLIALGVAAKIGSFFLLGYSRALLLIDLATKAYTGTLWFMSLGLEGAATAATYAAAALWATLWPLLAFGAAIWAVIDMVQHWEDWNNVVLLSIGPLGWVALLLQKIIQHWENITSLFEGEGILGAIKGIGTLIEDVILGTLIGALKIMGRITSFIPGVGSSFKEMAADLQGVKSNTANQLGAGTLADVQALSVFGGVVPQSSNAPIENTAGKGDSMTNELLKMFSKQEIELIVSDPGNNLESAKVNGKDYGGGIPAKTGSTTGNWWNP